MIQIAYIKEWQQKAPWSQDHMVEQDLIISRTLIELFKNPIISNSLAFRGGTALYKLHILPPARYSEDIDLVQIRAEPIGNTISAIKDVLEPFLGRPAWKLNEGRATLFYKFQTEALPSITAKLKIEINTREHFSIYGLCEKEYGIESRWYSDSTKIKSYLLEELLGTKLRALYQRKKGRDLFDLHQALTQNNFDSKKVVHVFQYYMKQENKIVTRAMFEKNLAGKLSSSHFSQDISPLLAPNIKWNQSNAAYAVKESFLSHLPGKEWVGSVNNLEKELI